MPAHRAGLKDLHPGLSVGGGRHSPCRNEQRSLVTFPAFRGIEVMGAGNGQRVRAPKADPHFIGAGRKRTARQADHRHTTGRTRWFASPRSAEGRIATARPDPIAHIGRGQDDAKRNYKGGDQRCAQAVRNWSIGVRMPLAPQDQASRLHPISATSSRRFRSRRRRAAPVRAGWERCFRSARPTARTTD